MRESEPESAWGMTISSLFRTGQTDCSGYRLRGWYR